MVRVQVGVPPGSLSLPAIWQHLGKPPPCPHGPGLSSQVLLSPKVSPTFGDLALCQAWLSWVSFFPRYRAVECLESHKHGPKPLYHILQCDFGQVISQLSAWVYSSGKWEQQ